MGVMRKKRDDGEVSVEGDTYFRDTVVCAYGLRGSTSEYTVNKYGLVPRGHASGASESHIANTR